MNREKFNEEMGFELFKRLKKSQKKPETNAIHEAWHG